MRKENQGLTEAGEFGWIPDFFVVHFSFFVVPGRGVLNTPHKRPGRGDLIYLWVGVFIPAGYMWGVCNTPLPYRQKKSRVRSWILPMRPRPFRC